MGHKLTWNGTAVKRLIEAAGTRGLREGNRQIRQTSQDRVPVQTGDLKGSLRHETSGLTSRITYTDSKAAAAHENLHHRTYRNGKQSKFLESAARDKRDEVLEAVADSIRKALS